eukprot:m.17123 g.17123  ORF g.17123 m.17123 type:complete len:407 (+) comp3210_c0_seq1:2207-3427(+)
MGDLEHRAARHDPPGHTKMEEESVEDALRDLGIEIPKPASQAWHFNPRVPRSVPPHEQLGEYTLILLTAIEEGSPSDGLVFDTLDTSARLQLAGVVYQQLKTKVQDSELDGKAMVGHVVKALQEALKTFQPAQVTSSPLFFDRSEKQGSRPSMEDKMTIVPDVNALFGIKGLPHQVFFGIFDGHAGVDAARYAQTHLLQHICSNEAFDTDLTAALKGAHASLDKAISTKPTRSGCTSVTAFLRGPQLYLSWLGDSSALLSRRGEYIQLMDPHKPGRPDEKARIEAAGGMVMQVFGVWRVNGVLSVARAFGDHNLKNVVISDPDISVVPLTGDEDFIVLACDGLWDVMAPTDVVKFVHDNVKRDEQGRAQPGVADQLSSHAISIGSTDNVSVIIAYFNPGWQADASK